MNLFIIGNGFDLEHQLATSFLDFRKFLIEDCDRKDFVSDFENLSSRCQSDGLWSNFEKSLGELSGEEVFDEAYSGLIKFNSEFDYDVLDDSFYTDFISEEYFNFLKEINVMIKEWVSSISINHLEKIREFEQALKQENIVVNFNYTKVLEDIYKIEISKILHIHGSVDDDPIIGFRKSDNIRNIDFGDGRVDYQFFTFRKNFNINFKMLHELLEKRVWEYISSLEYFLNPFSEKNENIIVIGHSLSEVDHPYFLKIKELVPAASWFISYFDEIDLTNKINLIKKLNLTDCKLFKNISDLTLKIS